MLQLPFFRSCWSCRSTFLSLRRRKERTALRQARSPPLRKRGRTGKGDADLTQDARAERRSVLTAGLAAQLGECRKRPHLLLAEHAIFDQNAVGGGEIGRESCVE